MTTLPQTTPVRLPALMPAGPQGPSAQLAPVPAAEGAQLTGADAWRIIRSHSLLIVFCVALFAIGGYLLNLLWLRYWPTYSAVGMVRLEQRVMIDPLNEKYNTLTRDEMLTELRGQAELFRSEALFAAVLKDSTRIRGTDWYREYSKPNDKGVLVLDSKAAKEYLQKHFSVSPIPESPLLVIRFDYRNAGDCKLVIEEIVERHLADQGKKQQARYTEQNTALNRMRGDYKSKLDGPDGVVTRVRTSQDRLARAGYTFGTGVFSVKEIELKALIEESLKTQRDAVEARGKADRVKAQASSAQEISTVERLIENDRQIMEYTQALSGYQIQKEVFVANGALPESPQVKRMDSAITVTQHKLDDRRNELRAKFRDLIVAELEGEAGETERLSKDYDQRITKMREELQALGTEISRYKTDSDEEKDLREQLGKVEEKIGDMSASYSQASRSPVEWAARPETPELPSWPKLPVVMSLAILLGLALSVGIAFLRFFMDDTVRSPRDITRVGNLNLLGIIADTDEDPQVADTRLPIFDAPHSMTAEQFRQFRTRLSNASPLDTTRSIMVTGPSPLDGKTTVAANLAAGLALNGRKILLVDSNFRRPDVHRLFGVGNDHGFSDVLNGTAAFDEVIAPTRVPNLSIMTSGPKPMNPTELFESQLLIDFIERALEEYDHVVFDSGPLLVVSESVAMAPRVDGVVTVVRAHSESRGLLQRMRDSLRGVKAEHIGVVLNAVRSQGGGYYRRSIKQFYNYQAEE